MPGGAAPRRRNVSILLVIAGALGAGACGAPQRGPTVFYLDGAGWYSSGGAVEHGLRKAGYQGRFRVFSWSAFLGPAQDHFVTAGSKAVARRLARQIERLRRDDPQAPINVMALSAGTAVVLNALESLPPGVKVDNVVLFSPTVSANHNLTRAMAHVRRNLYATCSSRDAIVGTLAVNADGRSGPPAGRSGFRMPTGAGEAAREAYRRVVNLPWRPEYPSFGWSGSHTSVTSSGFVAAVIAPRVLIDDPYPLDCSVVEAVQLGRTGGASS